MAATSLKTPLPSTVRPRMRVVDRFVILTGGTALAALMARLLYAPYQAVYGGRGADYMALATGSRLIGDRCLYCLANQARTQEALLGFHPTWPGFPATFANAPLSAWMIHPIASLSYQHGLLLFAIIGLLATCASLCVSSRLMKSGGLSSRQAALVTVAGLASLPAAMGLMLAQWTPLLLAAALFGLVALRGRQLLLAGLLLSVLFIKPQDAFLLIPALLLARSWRVAAGAILGGIAWWGSGFLLVGPSFLGDLVTLLRARQLNEGLVTAGLPSFSGFTPAGNAGVLPIAVVLGTAALVLLFVIRNRLRGDPEMAVVLGIGLSLLVAPHVFGDDLVLLVPAMVLLATRCSAALPLLLAALLNLGYLLDEHVLPGPRAAEALCTLLVVVLLTAIASARGGRLHTRLEGTLNSVLSVPKRILASLEPATGAAA